jgi:pimeloyl-ACP methyl ester carboxylesterase
MGTVLIILFLLIAVLVAASLALGRASYEVQSARDTEYLELEGVWVRYRVIGGGPPVVLVHGWLSSSRIWDDIAYRLAQRFTVYTLDLTGFGESDKPLQGYGIRNGSRLLYAFCAHFGLTRASIVGHDLGGDIAVKLAADHPDVAGRLVLVGTPASDDQIDLPTPLWLATLPVIGPIFYMLGRVARPVRSLWTRPFVAESEDLPEETVEDAGRSTPAAAARTLGVARRELSGGRLARQARMIRVPILVVTGEEDQIVDPQSAAIWARGGDQVEVVLLENCGHLPMVERTSEFNAHVLAFLTGDPRYLELVERPEPEGDLEEHEVESAVRDEDETEDLAPSREEPVPEDDCDDHEEPGYEEEAPPERFHRRPEDYPPSREPDDTFQNGNGAEDPVSKRPRREPVEGHPIPELPDDLFDWSDGPHEFHPREELDHDSRRRRTISENGEEEVERPPRPPWEDADR